MSQTATQHDPFRLGWRYLREVGPDGAEALRKIPLSERDLLFPQEEDFVVQREPHIRDWVYLRETFRALLQDRPSTRVFADHRIDFNLADVEPLGPDVTIVEELPEWDGRRGTLYLAEEGKALLVAEVTSPDTRGNDLGVKRTYYRQAQVPLYLIVDRCAGDGTEVALTVLRLHVDTYAQVAPDGLGRVWLPEFRAFVGIEDEAVWLYNQAGQRFEELPELLSQIAEARTELLEAAARRAQMEALLESESDERQAQAAGRRMADNGRRLAEAARERAETQLAQERAARLQLEERIRQLEAQLLPRTDTP